MANLDMDSLLHQIMAMDNHLLPIMDSQLDPLSFTSIMTMMMVHPANFVAEIPTILQEEQLDA